MSEESIADLKARLDELPDEALLQMQSEIEESPDKFAEHVGISQASEFLTALLIELSERDLVDLDDPKVTPQRSSRARLLRRTVGCAMFLGHMHEIGWMNSSTKPSSQTQLSS